MRIQPVRHRCPGAPGALRATLLAAAAAGFACASTPPLEEVPDAETYYNRGLENLEGGTSFFFFDDIDYPQAISYFQEVIDNYPYSEFAVLAELKIADVHFERDAYEEAESYYQDFVELHPNHPRVPYAIYRNGLCSFRQMRAADRDQGPTRDAISQFQALLERYPDADPETLSETRERLGDAEGRMARREIIVGDFYFDYGEYHASARRYRRALARYPDHDERLATMTKLGVSLRRLLLLYEAEAILRQVLASGPDEDLRDQVEFELAEIEELPRFGPRPLDRSCVTDPNPACPPTEDAVGR